MTEQYPKVIIFIPAYNTAKILPKTYRELPKERIMEIIMVDDGSSDNTAQVAEDLGITVVRHQNNRGYGGAQKTGYNAALKNGADIVVMVHSDYQYDPKMTLEAIELISSGKADAVTGTRFTPGYNAMKDGMPFWKYYANRFLTKLENLALGTNISDFHNGFRAYSSKVLRAIPFDKFSESFDFDSDILIQISLRDFTVAEIFRAARYNQENSQMPFVKGIEYGLSILCLVAQFKLHQWRIWPNQIFDTPSVPDKDSP
jgi:glycosyltransferase involved in cell wall biosynthesis